MKSTIHRNSWWKSLKIWEIFYPWDQCFKYLLQLVQIYLGYCLKFILNYKNWNTALVIFYLKKNMILLKPHVKLRIRGRLHTETNKYLKTCKFHSWTNEFLQFVENYDSIINETDKTKVLDTLLLSIFSNFNITQHYTALLM